MSSIESVTKKLSQAIDGQDVVLEPDEATALFKAVIEGLKNRDTEIETLKAELAEAQKNHNDCMAVLLGTEEWAKQMEAKLKRVEGLRVSKPFIEDDGQFAGMWYRNNDATEAPNGGRWIDADELQAEMEKDK